MDKPIDWKKPVQTRDGRPVRILCTDGPYTPAPIIGIVEGQASVTFYDTGGEVSRHHYNGVCYDAMCLINVPEPPKEHKVRVYFFQHPLGSLVPSLASSLGISFPLSYADAYERSVVQSSSATFLELPCIAVKIITFKEGDGLDE